MIALTGRCARCGALKPLGDFPTNRRKRNGRSSYCRDCSRAATRRWRAGPRYPSYRERRAATERARYAKKTPRIGTCARPGCEETFTTVQPAKRYCTASCAHAARTDRPGRPNQARRRQILNRDGWRCYLCGGAIRRDVAWPHPLSASVDHVVPRSAGGTDDDDNLRASHWGCNEAKGDALPGVEVWIPSFAEATR